MRMIVIKSLDSPSNSASYINFGEDFRLLLATCYIPG